MIPSWAVAAPARPPPAVCSPRYQGSPFLPTLTPHSPAELPKANTVLGKQWGPKREPPIFPKQGPGVDLGERNTREFKKEDTKKGKRDLHIFSSVSTSCCRRSIFSRLCQEKDRQVNADLDALTSKNILKKVAKKRQAQEAKITYLSLHAFLPSFCSCWRRGISRILGTRREVTGWEGLGEMANDAHPRHNEHLSHTLPPRTDASKQITRTLSRPVEAREW